MFVCHWIISDIFIKSLELCQVIVTHFVTLTDDSAAPGGQFQNCSAET